MPKNSNNNDVVELWEHDFAIVRNGLDEEQVISFVNELISQRVTFLQRQEHLSSLTKLAERITAEADNVAKQTKEEAVEQAKAETTAILAKAEEQAQQMIEEKRAEVIAMANREAESIRANAQQQATLLLEEKARSIQIELKDTVQSLSRQFLSQLESLQQQVIALEVEFEQTLSQAMKQPESIRQQEASSQSPVPMEQEYNVTPSIDSEVNTEPVDSILTKVMAQVHTVDQLDNSEVGKMTPLLAENEETVDYKGEIELQILPPVNIKQIMGIMRYLDSLSEIENTELIPVADRPSIIVFLREPVPLVEMLKTLPEVGQVDEVTSEEITSFPDIPQGKRRKIQITLSKDSILAEVKEILTGEASNTQPSEPSSNLK